MARANGARNIAFLRHVSHWTEADVLREKAIIEGVQSFEPSAVLWDSFAEIFLHCEFESWTTKTQTKPEGPDRIQLALETWKTTVEVQQHFNDLEMRIRNFAITVVGALLAALGFTYQQGLQADVFGFTIPAGLGFVFAALFAWLAFYSMDRYWYHVFLRGAVKHASTIEDEFSTQIPGIGLGKTISAVSANVKILGFSTNSEGRLRLFYNLGLVMLAILFVTLFLARPQPVPAPRVPAANSTTPPASQTPPK
jgi:hypothetical protein